MLITKVTDDSFMRMQLQQSRDDANVEIKVRGPITVHALHR